MTFFKNLMRILSAALASLALIVAPKLIAFFQGSAPSDVSAGVWALVGVVAVFLINWGVGKIPRPEE